MDLFAGSEPRNFISFHLDKEQTDQPPQEEKQASEQDISELDTTGADGAKAQSPFLAQESPTQVKNQNSSAGLTDELMDVQTVECTVGSSTGDGSNSFGTAMENPATELRSGEPDTKVSTQETNEAVETQQKLNFPALTTLRANNESALQESSSSQESCQTYFTRRMEELGAGHSTIPIPEVTVLPEKESFRGDLEFALGNNQATFNEVGTSLYPPVHFLNSDHSFCKDPRKLREPPQVKKTRVIVDTSGL